MKSKVPGVMITQFMEELPEGMTTPDFTRKPIALTIQEGNLSMSERNTEGHLFFFKIPLLSQYLNKHGYFRSNSLT